MFQRGKVLAIIPARSGSKGIKNKNIVDLCGKPLISWTVEAAIKCDLIDDVAISSDSETIISIAEKFGANLRIKRPAILSSDEASSVDVIMHALELYPNYHWFVMLQPTSPLRNELHITESFNLLKKTKSSNIVSVCESKSKPNHIFDIDNNTKTLKPILGWGPLAKPRQFLKKFYELNGAIYAGSTSTFRSEKCFFGSSTPAYIMDKSVSIDIDDPEDLWAAKAFIESEGR